MTKNKRYVRILDYSEKEVRIFDEHNQKNIFNIFFEGLDSAICLKGALEDTVDLLNYFYEENKELKFELKECRNNKLFSRRQLEKENRQLKADNNRLVTVTANVMAEHQKRTLDLIDNKIKELKNINNVLIIPRESIEVLKQLKQELQK